MGSIENKKGWHILHQFTVLCVCSVATLGFMQKKTHYLGSSSEQASTLFGCVLGILLLQYFIFYISLAFIHFLSESLAEQSLRRHSSKEPYPSFDKRGDDK